MQPKRTSHFTCHTVSALKQYDSIPCHASLSAIILLHILEIPWIKCRLNVILLLLSCPIDNNFEILDYLNMTGDNLVSWTLYHRDRRRKQTDHRSMRPPDSVIVVCAELLLRMTKFIHGNSWIIPKCDVICYLRPRPKDGETKSWKIIDKEV
jgi:hypothetical protein